MILFSKAVPNEWRKWFAWYPVITTDWQYVWLETVEKKLFNCDIPTVSPSSWIIYRRIKHI